MRALTLGTIAAVFATSLTACVTKTTVINSSTAQGWGGAPPVANVYTAPGAYYGAPSPPPPPPPYIPPGPALRP